MSVAKPSVRVEVTFHSKQMTDGQRWPIYPPFFTHLFLLGEDTHSCRIYFREDKPAEPGETRVFDVQFLQPELVMPKLGIGTNFKLRGVPIIAEGKVLEFLA